MKRGLVIACAAICVIGFPVSLWGIFFKAPLLDELYLNQKIFYYHVPSAFMLFAAVFVCGIWSVLYLRKREPRYDDVALAAADLAVLFGAIMMFTGVVWAKAAWGKWWIWEARLMSALLLWLIMLAYVAVRRYAGPGSERLAAGIGLFAMIDVPLIYGSVNIWRTQHPNTNVVPGLDGTMRIVFWSCVVLWAALFIVLFQLRLWLGRGDRLLRDAREHALDAGLIE